MMLFLTSGALQTRVSRYTSLLASCVLRGSRSLSSLPHSDAKRAAKEKRTDLFQSRLERAERVKNRREGRDTGVKKRLFDGWFEKKKTWEQIQDRKARQAGLEWKIDCSVIIERLPIVTPNLPTWAVDMETLMDYLNSFGKDYPKELNLGDRLPMGEVISDEEMFSQLPDGYRPGPRVTDADKNGDVKTLKRRLPERVYFLAQQKGSWAFPNVTLTEGETMLDAAKRGVQTSVGSEMDIFYLSNCPLAVNMVLFSESERAMKGFFGTKTFFMKVQHDEFDATLGDDFDDFAWLARDEITDRMKTQNGEHASQLYHYIL